MYGLLISILKQISHLFIVPVIAHFILCLVLFLIMLVLNRIFL